MLVFNDFKQSQGEISTRSGATSSAGGTQHGSDDEELAALEREVLAEFEKGMVEDPVELPPPAPVPVPKPPAKEPDVAKAPAPEKAEIVPQVTGSLAAGLEEGLLPSDLWDEKVYNMFEAKYSNLGTDEVKYLLSQAKYHPDFESYVTGFRVEHGFEDGEWSFGDEDPYEDLLGFQTWAFVRQTMRDRLALSQIRDGTGKKGDWVEPPPAAAAPANTKAAPAPMTKAAAPTEAVPKAAAAAEAIPKAAAAAAAEAIPKAATPPKAAELPPAPKSLVAPQSEVAATPATKGAGTPPAAATPPTKGAGTPPAPTPTAPAVIPPPAPAASKAASPTMMPPPAPPASKAASPGTPTPSSMPSPSELSTKVDQLVDKTSNQNLPTSTSHRSEYMAFLRAAKNPSKMAKDLIPQFTGNQASKLDLFRLWLEKGRDFAQVEVEVKRRNIQSHTAKSKDACMSRAQLEADPRYSKSDVDDLIRRKTAAGAYLDDPNFPGREDLRQYLIHAETSAEAARTREDVQQVGSNTRITAAEALTLTEEGCDFSNEHPSIKALAAEAGTTTGGDPTPEDKNKNKGKGRGKGRGKNSKSKTPGDGVDPEPEPDKPPTPLAKAMALKVKVFLV